MDHNTKVYPSHVIVRTRKIHLCAHVENRSGLLWVVPQGSILHVLVDSSSKSETLTGYSCCSLLASLRSNTLKLLNSLRFTQCCPTITYVMVSFSIIISSTWLLWLVLIIWTRSAIPWSRAYFEVIMTPTLPTVGNVTRKMESVVRL